MIAVVLQVRRSGSVTVSGEQRGAGKDDHHRIDRSFRGGRMASSGTSVTRVYSAPPIGETRR